MSAPGGRELRRCPFTGRWVAIAPARLRRPPPRRQPPAGGGPLGEGQSESPFAPGNERFTPHEIVRVGDPWQIRVLPNRAPALGVEGPLGARAEGLYDRMNGVGAHEILIEGRRPGTPPWRHPPALQRGILHTAQARLRDLRQDKRLETMIWFKDHGAEAGARHGWPHSQIVAFPFETPEALLDRETHARHHAQRGRCLSCDLLTQELEDGRRILIAGRRVVAALAWAPRAPFSAWLMPRHHQPGFEQADGGLIDEAADALRETLRRLDDALGDPPVSCALRTAPGAPASHWRLEITPALGGSRGLAEASGCSAHAVLPEEAAAFLRG